MRILNPSWRQQAGVLAVILIAMAAPTFAANVDLPRFSTVLSPAQRRALGFDKLTPQNIAAIDAQVRQDANDAARTPASAPGARSFSARRTAEEKNADGLTRLSAAEIGQLDAMVAWQIDAPPPLAPASPLVASPRGAVSDADPEPWETGRRPLEVHGSVSLSAGWSKAGNFIGGDAVVALQDPAHKFEVVIGYSEYHGKGLFGPAGCLPGDLGRLPYGPDFYGR